MSFMIDISEVQPSQLYISRDKLESVSKWIEVLGLLTRKATRKTGLADTQCMVKRNFFT